MPKEQGQGWRTALMRIKHKRRHYAGVFYHHSQNVSQLPSAGLG
ncbi:hypothetical protein PANA5342_pPANA10127 (plasmid) [Pantoea ananatis LMG 5342]|nr:hypothetical protein PANA5342_pPANA10127 [Pantoea ananatis LMG 5342]